MKSSVRTLILATVIITIVSCDKLYNDSRKLKDEVVEGAIAEVDKRFTCKVFPAFNHDKPDTENNKQRFKDFIKVEITPDVKDIYCFDDAIGIDAAYMFAFTCDPATSNKIIELHNLTVDTLNTDNGFYIQHDFEWWNKEKISKLQKYSWTDGSQYYKYYWFDRENQKAYFFDFDI